VIANSFKAFLNLINENQPNELKQFSSSKDPYAILRRCIFSLPPCSSVYNKYENSRLENPSPKQFYLTEQTNSNKQNQDFSSVYSKSDYQISNFQRISQIIYRLQLFKWFLLLYITEKLLAVNRNYKNLYYESCLSNAIIQI